MTKLVLTMVVIGFLAYDGISILVASINTSDKASTLANEAADSVKGTKNIQTSYAQIEGEAKAAGYTIAPKDFRVSSTGEVTLILRKTANSLWMTRISSLQKYLDISETGTGNPPS